MVTLVRAALAILFEAVCLGDSSGRDVAGHLGEEELRGQDQGEPGEDHWLPHPRRHGWLLWQIPLRLRPTYFCRRLVAFPSTVVSCSLAHRLVFVGVCMVAS